MNIFVTMTTSASETVFPPVRQSNPGPMSSSARFELSPTQTPQSYPSLTPQSLPIAIELHDGNHGTVINTGQRSFVIDNGNPSQQPNNQEVKPENHMMLGFLSTLFCACPCGLMSLCHAIQVNSDYSYGNRVGANYNSQQAWRWGLASVVLGSLCVLIIIMYYLVLMAIHVS